MNTDAKRKCDVCGQPMLPVQTTTCLKLDVGVIYPDNLWAIDGMAADLTPTWACRKTCTDPIPVGDTSTEQKEWEAARERWDKKLFNRQLRARRPSNADL